MGVLVHPQLGLGFGAALPGACFSQTNSTFAKNIFFLFLVVFQLIFLWKWRFWFIPSSVFGLVQPCRGLFFRRKTTLLRKNIIVDDFQMIFYQNGPNVLLTRGTTIKTGILTLVELWWVS